MAEELKTDSALPKKGFGELLVEKGLITRQQLEVAIKEQERTKDRLGQILVRRGFVSQRALGKLLESQVGVPYVHLADMQIDQETVRLLTESQVRKFKALPVRREGMTLHVAMIHPINLMVVDELKLITGCRIQPMITTERELEEAINRAFDVREKASQAIEEFRQQRGSTEEVEAAETMEVEDVPVVRLVNSVLIGGINAEASDIHLEPQQPQMRVRYRVDGLLQDAMTIPKYIERAAISRLKVMAGLNIAERRMAQDGQMPFEVDGRKYDLRVATLPTYLGEKVVIRILEKEKVLIGIGLLGMLPEQQEIFQQMIQTPWGMILVSGPTGSGKTTTLYAVLNELNDPTKNIVTVEEPVEFHLSGINQVQVNPKAGITFASALRSVLRQDPNIIMVGEIRDEETARVSVHSALTGHLVLSTIHTTDASSVLIRLLELGIEPYLVASTLVGAISQRLVRIICSACKEAVPTTDEEKRRLEKVLGDAVPDRLFRGSGCPQCFQSGYRGRTGIFEVMRMTRELRDMTTRRSPAADIREAAERGGMLTLFEMGVRKVLDGVTTLDEVVRVAYREE